MQEFKIWLEIGITHILSIKGIDHLLFILSLSLLYSYKHIKKLFILISGFTIGHTLSLLYCALTKVSINTVVVEFLIPITIIVSAISNLTIKNKNVYALGILTVFFGLLHGLAFSGSIKSLLSDSENIIVPLISFNIGVEIAQMFLFLIYILVSILIIKSTKIKNEQFNKSLSALIAGSGLFICYNKLCELI